MPFQGDPVSSSSLTGTGGGLLKYLQNLINPTWSYNTANGPRPRGSAMDRLKAELEKQKQNRAAREQSPVGQGRNDINSILEELRRLQDYNRYMPNPDDLERQAMAAASAQFDPIISSLRGQASNAQTRAGRYDQQLNNMYTSLSGSLREDIPKVEANFAETKADTASEYQQLQDSIKNTYAQTQADQEAMYKRLNIQAAAPDVMGQQMRDRDFFVNNAAQQGQTMQSALGLEERGATEYSRRGSQIAEMTGVERRADLGAQLQEMLAAIDSEIAKNEAAKQAAVASARGDLASQAQKSAMDRAQRDFDNFIKVNNVGRDLQSDALKLGGMVNKVSSPADVAGRALGLGLNNYSAQRLQNAFMSSVGSDELILGGLNPESGTPATKEALARQIVEQGRRQGLSQAELNALQLIALEYFGRS